MALTLRDADVVQMKTVETRMSRLLSEYRQNTESALVVFACVRIARTLLRLYPKPTQKVLVDLCCAFLRGDASAPGVEGSMLWTPDGSTH